jgi:hypothetical protein
MYASSISAAKWSENLNQAGVQIRMLAKVHLRYRSYRMPHYRFEASSRGKSGALIWINFWRGSWACSPDARLMRQMRALRWVDIVPHKNHRPERQARNRMVANSASIAFDSMVGVTST